MIATELLYQFIKGLIATIPEIKHFDWWNDNTSPEMQEAGTSFPKPAVFFEYNPIVWEPSTAGTDKNQSSGTPQQMATAEFNLHIIYKKIESSAIDAAEVSHMQIVELVFRKVHFSGITENYLVGHIQRIRDEQVLTHRVLRDWPLAFGATLFECPTPDADVQPVEPWTPDVQIEIKDKDLNDIEPFTKPGGGIVFTVEGQ